MGNNIIAEGHALISSSSIRRVGVTEFRELKGANL
jgi:hypothetical protein